MPYNSKIFGLVIARLRAQRGLSQEKLSGLAGISRSHLAAVEYGQKTVRMDTLWRLCEALRLRPSQLLSLVETELEKAEHR